MAKSARKKDDKRFTKPRGKGRPKGTYAFKYPQSERINFRCTEGYFNTLIHLQNMTAKSASELLHQALEAYAMQQYAALKGAQFFFDQDKQAKQIIDDLNRIL
jgi:hypothetical protein